MSKASVRERRRVAAASQRRGRPRPNSGLKAFAVLAAVGAVVAAVAAIALGSGPSEPSGKQTTLEPTGETAAMGVPVVVTPGSASGVATAGSVQVDAANWAMGQVPLDVAVRPSWTIRNTGSEPVSLGEPSAVVRAGCCPGPLVLGQYTLAPGESTELTFELAMHEGMDGWHDMGVYVPVSVGSGEQVLELSVTGDFRN